METVDDCLELMQHLSDCESSKCDVRGCLKIKKALRHAKECKRKGQCYNCKQMLRICVLHARNCVATNCKIYLCGMIRMRISVRQEALRNKTNRPKIERTETAAACAEMTGQIRPHLTTDGSNESDENCSIGLQRSASCSDPSYNRDVWMQMQRCNSINVAKADSPEIVRSGLLQGIDRHREALIRNKDLAAIYEKMDISQN